MPVTTISRRIRIMFDTSAIIAGVLSSEGGAGAIMEACRVGIIELYLSPGIIEEASAKFNQKFPHLLKSYLTTLGQFRATLVPNPDTKTIKYAAEIIHKDDAPILAAAMAAPIDYLITLDQKHFKTTSVVEAVSFEIATPGEFLREFS